MFLILVQYQIKISMGIENSTPNKMMCRFSSKFLNSCNNLLIDWETSEFLKKFVIVDLFARSVWNLVWVYYCIFIYFLFLYDGLLLVGSWLGLCCGRLFEFGIGCCWGWGWRILVWIHTHVEWFINIIWIKLKIIINIFFYILI